MRTVADLTAADYAKEVERAILLVESSVGDLESSPSKYAKLALMTAVADWQTTEESFHFLEGRYIEDISALHPRLATSHRRMEDFSVANGLALEAIKRPTVAYLRKQTSVTPFQATLALVPLLNDITDGKSGQIAAEIEHWIDLAERNGDPMHEWLKLIVNIVENLKPDFVESATRLSDIASSLRDQTECERQTLRHSGLR